MVTILGTLGCTGGESAGTGTILTSHGLAVPDDDGDLTPGDTVTAIGNAEGSGDLVAAARTVTGTQEQIPVGTSAADVESLEGLVVFEPDAAAGDSGGPVLDDEEVVGITTAASTGSAVTAECAITMEDALLIVERIRSGSVQIGHPAFLGVSFGPTSLGRSGSSSATAGPRRTTAPSPTGRVPSWALDEAASRAAAAPRA